MEHTKLMGHGEGSASRELYSCKRPYWKRSPINNRPWTLKKKKIRKNSIQSKQNGENNKDCNRNRRNRENQGNKIGSLKIQTWQTFNQTDQKN